MNRASAVILAVVALFFATPIAHGAELMHFSVTQVRQLEIGEPLVRAYLDLADADGHRPEYLSDEDVKATLGEHPATVVGLTPAWTTQDGVAYIFLVDISRSLSPALFQRMLDGIETWVKSLGPTDRAAIIAFGESSRELVDFTNDQERLLSVLESLRPTDDLTLLHQALFDGLELSRRLDPDLPGRRVIVVFSDGKDEGSPFHADDLMARLRSDPTPIYAIGYSGLANADERRSYLELLQRFASNSGGTFFAAEQTRFEEAYDAIHAAIGDVWIADLACSECRLDGSLLRLQVRVDIEGRALSSGGSVRLLPLATAGAPSPATTRTEPARPQPDQQAEPEAVHMADESKELSPRIPRYVAENLGWWVGGIGLLIGLAILWQLRSSRRRSNEWPTAPAGYQAELPPGPIDPRSEPNVLDPPMPVPHPNEQRTASPAPHAAQLPRTRQRRTTPPKQVRLIVVRGSRRGRQYSFVVSENARIGKRSDSDCVLAEEPGIDSEQFELIHEHGALYLRNLSSLHPTLVNGEPATSRIRLTSDSLIGTGETVLRIVFR